MIVVDQSSIGHQNMSYDYENNFKYRQKPKIRMKISRRKCQNPQAFPPETISLINLTSSWSKWELSILR